MWLYTKHGMLSIVADHDKQHMLVIRARNRAHIHALIDLMPVPGDWEIETTPANDYRYRTRMPRAEAAFLMMLIVSDIDYPNFKNAVFEELGREAEIVHSHVWGETLSLSDGASKYTGRPGV